MSHSPSRARAGDPHMDIPLRVLLVCTGNICRSPAAEIVARHRFAGAPVVFVSAGTEAMLGQPVADPMARLLNSRGLPSAGFRSRPLTPRMVATADIILTATRRQVSDVVASHPQALRRTATLRECARAAEAVLDRGDPLVTLPASMRCALLDRRPAQLKDDDIPDPYQRDIAAYRHALFLIEDSVAKLAAAALPTSRARHV